MKRTGAPVLNRWSWHFLITIWVSCWRWPYPNCKVPLICLWTEVSLALDQNRHLSSNVHIRSLWWSILDSKRHECPQTTTDERNSIRSGGWTSEKEDSIPFVSGLGSGIIEYSSGGRNMITDCNVRRLQLQRGEKWPYGYARTWKGYTVIQRSGIMRFLVLSGSRLFMNIFSYIK